MKSFFKVTKVRSIMWLKSVIEKKLDIRPLGNVQNKLLGLIEKAGFHAKDFVLFEYLSKVNKNVLPHFSFLFAYVLIFNREGSFVPSNNEFIYLLELAKLWNPNVLPNDWTFSTPSASHLVFNLLFGPLSLVFSLEVVGWIGRFLSWSLILAALFHFGKHFRIPLWMITVSILLWLFYRQSIVAGEWILGTFEAKSIAYALLICSLNGFMEERWVMPSICLGLSFSFHPVVGSWAVLGIGCSLVILRYPIRKILRFGFYTALFALPGLLPLLMTPVQGGIGSAEALKFVTLVVMPYHFDPFYFASSKRLIVLLFALLCFNWVHFRLAEYNRALQFLVLFQVVLGLFFVLGFVARFTEKYEFLILMPWRLFSVLVPLFFFFHLMSMLRHRRSIKGASVLVTVGVVALGILGNPINLLFDRVAHQYEQWTRQDEDWEKAFKWIAKNTPPGSVIISPPWRGESFYLSKRAQVVNWWAPRFDRLNAWRERLELVGGDVSGPTPGTTKARLEQMAAHYNRLTVKDVESIAFKYGGQYLVSTATYSYPVLITAGRYKVYSLKETAYPKQGIEHPYR